jgi:topoisomerase-4 subunit A
VELVKGKGKEKETETMNLEDIVDVKGWKALGNRLSQHKVIKVRPLEEPEDSSTEEGEDDEATSKATGTGKGTESPKKKSDDSNEEDEDYFETSGRVTPEAVIEEDGQTALFGEAKQNIGPNVNSQSPKAKATKPKEANPPYAKASGDKQADLFGESKKEEVKKREAEKKGDKTFTAGDSIELDL